MIEARQLTKVFKVHNHLLTAVNDVSFSIGAEEIVGVIGESGCGKSTLGKLLLGFDIPTSGQILYRQKPLSEEKQLFRKAQMLFQDPYRSLNPKFTIEQIVEEGLVLQTSLSSAARRDIVYTLLKAVGLESSFATRLPHECSGGQRQRIALARALAIEPELLVCDEPLAALDVVTKKQMIELLQQLHAKRPFACLFISHDLSPLQNFCSRIAVMYLGRFVEIGPSAAVIQQPRHPYTQALLSAIPVPDPQKERQRQRLPLIGDPPSPTQPPTGCSFHPRCPYANDKCRLERPLLQEKPDGQLVACHHT